MCAHTHTCSGHLCLQVRLCACARASYCPLLCRWASFGPRGVFERFPPPRSGAWSCFPKPGSSPVSPRAAVTGQPLGLPPFLGFYSSGLARERGPGPGRRLPLGLRASASVSPMAAPLPSGLQAGRLGAFWDQASSLPAPEWLLSRFMAPGQRRGACSLDVGRFLLASPAR